jgi:hypothetical protein
MTDDEPFLSPARIYGELRAISATVATHVGEMKRLSDLIEKGQARQDDRVYLVSQRLGVIEGEMQGVARRSGFVAAAIAAAIGLFGTLLPHWFAR